MGSNDELLVIKGEFKTKTAKRRPKIFWHKKMP
jgi:hypothetical protein